MPNIFDRFVQSIWAAHREIRNMKCDPIFFGQNNIEKESPGVDFPGLKGMKKQ